MDRDPSAHGFQNRPNFGYVVGSHFAMDLVTAEQQATDVGDCSVSHGGLDEMAVDLEPQLGRKNEETVGHVVAVELARNVELCAVIMVIAAVACYELRVEGMGDAGVCQGA